MTPRRNRLLSVLGAAVVVALVVGLLAWQPWSSNDGDGSRSATGGGPTDLAVTVPTPDPAADRSTSAAPVHVDAAVADEIAQKGSTRVLVSLDVSPTGTDAERAAQIRTAIDGLVASLPVGSVSNVDSQNLLIPVAILDVTAIGLDALQRRAIVVAVDADVRRSVIEEVGEADIAATMDAVAKAQGGTGPALNTPSAANTSTTQIGAPQAWAAGWRGAGGVVAVLDSGVQSNHPYLAVGGGSKVIGEACFVTPGGSWSSPCPGNVSMGVDDAPLPGSGQPCGVTACSHGTHVAGIAVGGNGITDANTPSGVAPDARLVAVQVFATNGTSIGASDSDIVHAINWLYNNRAAFPGLAAVNLSLGSGMYTGYCDTADWFYKAAFDLLGTVGIVVVVASGNNGYQNAVSSPACVSSAVTVGAVDSADATTYYSNDGPQLDLMAPGSGIYSSVPNSSMAYKSGTSMATPAVAGAIAMLRQPDAATAVAMLRATGPDVNASGFHTPRIAVGSATAALPGAPTSVTAQVQPGHGDVIWDAPANAGSSAIIGYTVAASPGGATCATTGATSCAVRGLVEGTSYTFSVRAVNASGAGPTASSSPTLVPPPGPMMTFNAERFMDTSPSGSTIDDVAEATGAFGAGEWRTLQIAGRGSVPAAGVGAVAVTLTAVTPSSRGYVAVSPTRPASAPTTSNLNFATGQTASNAAIVTLSGAGTIEVFNSAGANNLQVDVMGWSPVAGSFQGVEPARLLETRAGKTTVDGVAQGGGAVLSETELQVPILGRGGVPATGVSAVAVNVTAVLPTFGGFLTVYPSGVALPDASTLNFTTGRNVANLAVIPVGADGSITLRPQLGVVPGQSVHLLIDVTGWFPSTGSFTGTTPARLLETRALPRVTIDGIAQGAGPSANGSVTSVPVLGRGGVPASGVSSVVVNVTAVLPTANGSATVFARMAPGVAPPVATSLSFGAGLNVPGLVIARVAPDGTISISLAMAGGSSSAHLLVDVMGWFP